MIPYQPLRVDHGVLVFDLRDVVMYGEPCFYGLDRYLVIDHPDISSPMVMDYHEEQARRGALRPIHRYDASKRFEYLLRQLLGGCRSKIPVHVMELVSREMDPDEKRVWNSVRAILKKNGYQRYFNRIPGILINVGYDKRILWHGSMEGLVQDFQILFSEFQGLDKKRSYFPNFRFFALKILKRRGCVFEYDIPFMQTKSKIEVFQDLWNELEPFLS